ncbi:hypothetical protein [Salinibaculum rarum]|uniref:hypothetical protein n=1 Tax=Salinibaculum rarum TaxID=3058903 RepID=UPI0026601B17|nr:hypothetical protein [Salinibaculum sp. KK48]
MTSDTLPSQPAEQATTTEPNDRAEIILVEDFLNDNAHCRIIAREEEPDPNARGDPWWEIILQGYTDKWVDGETLGTCPDINDVKSDLPALMSDASEN